MSEFAATFVPDSLVTSAAEGDDLAMSCLMSDIRMHEMIEGWSDARLSQHLADLEVSYRIYADNRDWNEVEDIRMEIFHAQAHQEHRVELKANAIAREQYTNRDPLTYNPFTALLSAWDQARVA